MGNEEISKIGNSRKVLLGNRRMVMGKYLILFEIGEGHYESCLIRIMKISD